MKDDYDIERVKLDAEKLKDKGINVHFHDYRLGHEDGYNSCMNEENDPIDTSNKTGKEPEQQSTDKSCPDCEGVGFYDNNGMVPVDPDAIFEEDKNYCSNCDGTGKIPHNQPDSTNDEDEAKNIQYVIFEQPLDGLLYDLDLMPEQTVRSPINKLRMMVIQKLRESNQKAQEEIEELKGIISRMIDKPDTVSRIKELEQQIEAMKYKEEFH